MFRILSVCLYLCLTGFSYAQSQASITLNSGAVLASDQATLYAANPSGKVIAVDAENGRTLWTSDAVGRPLAIFDNQLIVLAQAEPDGANAILLLDLKTGADIETVALDIGSARAVIVPLPNQSFGTMADATDAGIRVYWEFEAQPLQGAAMFEMSQASDSVSLFGAFDVDLSADPASVQNVELASRDEIPRFVPNLPISERRPDLTGEQFRAANNAHLQTNRAVDDARFGSVYRWSIIKTSGEALGNITLPYAYTPYSVRANELLTQLPPYAVRRADGEIDAFSARIASFNLQTAREIWSIDVLDPVYRGILPP